MLINYLKIATRLLTRNKLVSLINIFGLALALSGSLLIAVFIHDELSYDRHHKNADKIYRVTRKYVTPEGKTHMHLGHLAPPFAPLLKNDFPDVIAAARFGSFSGTFVTVDEKNETHLETERAYFADPSVIDVFSLNVLSGDKKNVLVAPLTVILSDYAARKYFGNEDVIGKQIKMFDKVMAITGTFRSFPEQSHIRPEMLVSLSTLEDETLYGREKLEQGWENNGFLTYILVNDQFDPAKAAQQTPGFIDRHMPPGEKNHKQSETTDLVLQPLTSIHLHSHLDSEDGTNGNINHVYAMGAIGVFLIVIACFNFVNLSTARATQRGKEVGLRKVSGALRGQLIFQYISESTLIVLLAMIVAVAIASAGIGWLNHFTHKHIDPADYFSLNSLAILAVFVLTTGVLAGLYPAFVISGYQPAKVLKGQMGSIPKGATIRKALVIVQFSISTVMIIATLIIYQQLKFMNNKELGYEKDQVITFRFPEDALDHYDAFYTALKDNAAISNAAQSNRIPTVRLLETNYVNRVNSPEEKKVVMKNVSVDQQFFNTFGINVVAGQNFSKKIEANTPFEERVANGYVLNERAVQALGWRNDEAVGKEIINGGVRSTVVGVVKDFHFESLHEPIAPIVFMTFAQPQQVSVRIASSEMHDAIQHIERAWKQYISPEPMKYEFLSDRYTRLYDSEARQQELFVIFAVLAIFIASLGLFGLATFNTIQRDKEISIRKILGASVQNIVHLLSKEIVVLILTANLIAWPVAWYLMNQWLHGFAYHIDIHPLVFVTAGLLTLLITLSTISIQTVRAALANPAERLRSE